MKDEASFRPQLFIEPDVFERRLDYLKKNHFSVVPLADAVTGLKSGKLPPDSVVLTIDDGFFSTFKHAVPALAEKHLPATLYVTTYYSEKGSDVFRLAVQYLFWATRRAELNPEEVGLQGLGTGGPLGADRENDPLMWKVIQYGETRLDEPGRQQLLARLADTMGVSLDDAHRHRTLSLMTSEEIRRAEELGIDIQLHTHRHRFPTEREAAKKEIADNRTALQQSVKGELVHFCYPSGIWTQAQFGWLAEMGVKSATTCDVGFNRAGEDPLALKRVFDGSHVSDIEFEAEMNGYLELIRVTKAALRGLLKPVPARVANADYNALPPMA